jgi:hypothetical protein
MKTWLAIAACLAAGCEPAPPASPALPETPRWLSETGLYADIAGNVIAAGVEPFEPAYPLWSDGLVKRRWLWLPDGARVDTSDMDHWQFPVGAMLFKEFAADGRRIETRLIARTGSGPRDYWMGAFVWSADESDARFVPDGEPDAGGTEHDVPAARLCSACHDGERGRVLGLSAVQGADLGSDRVTDAIPGFSPPGDDAAGAALGVLHVNCGHCHNPNGSARPDSAMDLRLSVGDRRVADTGAYRTAIGQRAQSGRDWRIAPGEPDRSLVVARMSVRGTRAQMPPIGSEQIDRAGVAAVRTWIDSLTAP